MIKCMKTARFLPAQIWTISQADEGNTVYIRPEGSNLVVPVYVSEADIQSILVELTHILAPRPMVHELLLSAINSLDGKLDRVEIYGIRNGTCLCRVVLLRSGKEIFLESRPADILCLSARIDCPVQIDDDVVAKHGMLIERVNASHASTESQIEAPSVAGFLQRELKGALDREDYERAAVLRDRIVALEAGIGIPKATRTGGTGSAETGGEDGLLDDYGFLSTGLN